LAAKLAYTATTLFQKEKDVCTLNAAFAAEKQFKPTEMRLININTRKEYVKKPQLGMQVFHESIYDGNELMKVVGIRETEVELQGDYSGGTHRVIQKDWLPISGVFRRRKICDNQKYPNGCPLPNVHCGYPDCEPYVNHPKYYDK
jgi:hypothetical protein